MINETHSHWSEEEGLMQKTANLMFQFIVPPSTPCLRVSRYSPNWVTFYPSVSSTVHSCCPNICTKAMLPSPTCLELATSLALVHSQVLLFTRTLLFQVFAALLKFSLQQLKIWITIWLSQPYCGFILKSCSGLLDCFLSWNCQYRFSVIVGPIEHKKEEGSFWHIDLSLGNLILGTFAKWGPLVELGVELGMLMNRVSYSWRR